MLLLIIATKAFQFKLNAKYYPQNKTTLFFLLFLYDFKTLFLKMKINNILLLCVFCCFSKFYIIFNKISSLFWFFRLKMLYYSLVFCCFTFPSCIYFIVFVLFFIFIPYSCCININLCIHICLYTKYLNFSLTLFSVNAALRSMVFY